VYLLSSNVLDEASTTLVTPKDFKGKQVCGADFHKLFRKVSAVLFLVFLESKKF